MTKDTELQSLYGIVEFDDSIICAREVLGQKLRISIGGVDGTLEMPSLPAWKAVETDPLHMPLLAPKDAEKWKFGDKPILWGFPREFPKGIADINRALLSFRIPPAEMESAATAIYVAFNDWFSNLNDYIDILTKRSMHDGVTVRGQVNNLDLFCWNQQGKTRRPYNQNTAQVFVRMMSENQYLTTEQLIIACSYCSDSIYPRLEHRIILEAYRAMSSRDYRKAVIEAATAAELALTNGIRVELAKSGISFADKLLGKFRMLSGRFELARIIGITLPDMDFQANLIEPRNNVIHKAAFAGEIIAHRAIESAGALLTSLSQNIGEE